MNKVGTVQEIWRYPVKGMAGEKVASCALGGAGVSGDRLWALRDHQRDEIQSCKFRPELLQCKARWRYPECTEAGHPVDIVFPDGAVMGSDHPDIDARLSQLVGHASTLEALFATADLTKFRRYKSAESSWLAELAATFEREPGEPLPEFFETPETVEDNVTLPGSFFLVAPIHLVTTATLTYLRCLNPSADWDARRFRPNLVIKTGPKYQGLIEQQWSGRQLKIGEAVFACTGTTPRCGAITRAQPGVSCDTRVLRTVVRNAEQNTGVYGEISVCSRVNVGDEVQLI